jgi:hypothetical protein
MNDDFAAPTNFFALASLRHAVRLACFAAASPEDAGEAAAALFGAAAGEPVVAGSPAITPAIGNTLKHTAAARVKDRMLMTLRIAPTGMSTDEARMKLA